jgi:hypothetical protein
MGEKRNLCRVMIGKPDVKRPFRRWENGISMDLRKTGWGVWIQLAQYRCKWRAVVNSMINLRVLTPRI